MKINKKIISKIKKAKRVALFTHISPDADAICSCLALKNILQAMGKFVDVFVEKIPNELKFLNIENEVLLEKPTSTYDLAIALDTASMQRLGIFADFFTAHNNTIEFDHHSVRQSFAKLAYVDENSSSTAEIIYSLIYLLKQKIDDQLASYLYMGIASDTGCFLYGNSSKNSHYVASKLLEYNVQVAEINNRLFQRFSNDEFKILTLILSKAIVHDKMIYSILDSRILNSNKIEDITSKNFANTILSLEGMELGIIALEKTSGEFKLSMRSTNEYDCSLLASRFGGGGHARASGCIISGNANDVKKLLIKEYDNGKKSN